MNRVEIDNRGIKRALRKFEFNNSIAEYIWNGFDAGATQVNVIIEKNQIGHISRIEISDNGTGIPFQTLEQKFTPFLSSDKEINPDLARKTSKVHGVNGVGRLTFFSFARIARWNTIYCDNGKNKKYTIQIDSDSLRDYSATEELETEEVVGTSVIFIDPKLSYSEILLSQLLEFLNKEFCWFLFLHEAQNYSIVINNTPLDIYQNVTKSDNLTYKDEKSAFDFRIRFIQWKEKPREEYSKYYFLDSNYCEKLKITTTLNNKGDKFYHSLFVYSPFFDQIEYTLKNDDELDNSDEEEQYVLAFSGESTKEIYKRLKKRIEIYLEEIRTPYIDFLSDNLLKEYAEKGIFPKNSKDPWDIAKQRQLEVFVKELYRVSPKIFINLNYEQQKTFISLLDIVMKSDENEALFKILDEVVKLTPEQREHFSEILKTTSLANITNTIRLISDRLTTISDLRKLIDKNFGANEVDHIQKFMESNFWIVGEQYHLVTAAEPDFEQALRRLIQITTGVDEKQTINHVDKNKEMDIFAIRRLHQIDEIENVVIELKNPKINLGEKEVNQVKRYSRVIRTTDGFNGSNMVWSFYLIGNKFDDSGYIETELDSGKNLGERFLIQRSQNIRIYVMKWSEVITNFEIRYQHLLEILKLDREKLISNMKSPDDLDLIIKNRFSSSTKSEFSHEEFIKELQI